VWCIKAWALLLHWKFDNNRKTWHSLDCKGGFDVLLHDGHHSCIPCCNAQNNIQRDAYPWLFKDVKILPSNMEIFQYIQYLYDSRTLHEYYEGMDIKIDDIFINNNMELCVQVIADC